MIEEVFDARARIDADTHGAHHEWVEEQIALIRERRESYRKVRDWVVQWSVLGLLTVLSGWLSGVLGSIWSLLKSGHWPQ